MKAIEEKSIKTLGQIDTFFSVNTHLVFGKNQMQNRFFAAAIKMAGTGLNPRIEDIKKIEKVEILLPDNLHAYPIEMKGASLGITYYHSNTSNYSRTILKNKFDKHTLMTEGYNTQIGMAHQLYSHGQCLVTVNLGKAFAKRIYTRAKKKSGRSAVAEVNRHIRQVIKAFDDVKLVSSSLEVGRAGIYEDKDMLHIHIILDSDKENALKVKQKLQVRFKTERYHCNTQAKECYFTAGAIDYTDAQTVMGTSYQKEQEKAEANNRFYKLPNSGKQITFSINATKVAKEFHTNLCKSSKQLLTLYKQLGDHVGDKDKEECPTERYLSGLDA